VGFFLSKGGARFTNCVKLEAAYNWVGSLKSLLKNRCNHCEITAEITEFTVTGSAHIGVETEDDGVQSDGENPKDITPPLKTVHP
jgi:hypothetical protein